VDTKLKTGIAESLLKQLMKIAQKLFISDKANFEQLTTTEQDLWTRFETADIYRFLTGEKEKEKISVQLDFYSKAATTGTNVGNSSYSSASPSSYNSRSASDTATSSCLTSRN
jgi:hypothetical protein